MSGKHPKTIFSDQAQAIGNAIQKVMPNTHHRLCLWHIYHNAAKHLSHIYAANKDFTKDFESCLYSAETEEEFESLWDSMITKYSLSDNDWLINLYSLREKWAPVYGREHFCAGMTTTQRSESVNSFVKGYLSSSLRINDFITQYEKAMMNWREKELQADYRCKQITKPVLVSPVPFERQAFKIYTSKVFKMFQDKLKKIGCYLVHMESENDLISTYKVEMLVPFKNDKDRRVHFDKKEKKVECSCNGFQFTGILCVHAMRVLLSRKISEIPTDYFLKRWTMKARDGIIVDNLGAPIVADYNESSSVRYSDLANTALIVAMKGSIDEESSSIVRRHLAACTEELNGYQKSLELEAAKCQEQESKQAGNIKGPNTKRRNVDGQVAVTDPPLKKKKKGDPFVKYKSALDTAFIKKVPKKASKKRYPGYWCFAAEHW